MKESKVNSDIPSIAQPREESIQKPVSHQILERTIVIIPAYNEEKNITRIVQGIQNEFSGLDVVVVDDGSSDHTVSILEIIGAAVLKHSDNLGYGVSLQTGYKYALKKNKYDFIVQMDGDGQHNYHDISKLLAPLVENKADLVIGSRFLAKENSYRVPLVRQLGMMFFRLLVAMFTSKRIKDITSGFQAFNKKILNRYTSDDFPSYYPDANILILLVRNGFSILEIPSAMSENKEGKSMHKGMGAQLYYVITMSLSILVVLLKSLGKRKKKCP